MEPILVDDRYDLGEFGDLMDQGRGILALEIVTATTAVRRLALEGLVDLLGGDQRALGLTPSGLSAAFLLAGRSGGLPLHSDRIGRGRLGGVGGVELQSGLEVADAGFELGDVLEMALNQDEDRRLDLGRGAAPKRIRERRRGCHLSKIVSWLANSKPTP
jgi:hypothetical protein